MKRIASVRCSLLTVFAVLCGLALARMFACPDPILAVERGESIRSELRALREEVEIVRRDVHRLIELLEKRQGDEHPSQRDKCSDAPSDSVRPNATADLWDLTLRETITIALQNLETLRVVSAGPAPESPIAIYRKDPDVGLTYAEDKAVTLVSDVEQAYWDLWLAYRNLDTITAARDVALESWRGIRAQKEGFGLVAECDARKQYFLFRGQAEGAFAELDAGEKRLRAVLGLAREDGRMIRPADEPALSEPDFDWDEALAQAHNLPELKRGRWQVRRREAELEAVMRTGAAEGNDRARLAGERHARLQLARERALLQDAEVSVAQQLADALRDLDRAYKVAQTNQNRRVAAERETESLEERLADGKVPSDVLADAHRRRVAATTEYWRSVADFATALRQVHLKKGSLLSHRHVVLDETAAAEPEAGLPVR